MQKRLDTASVGSDPPISIEYGGSELSSDP